MQPLFTITRRFHAFICHTFYLEHSNSVWIWTHHSIAANLHGFAMKRAVTYGTDVAAKRIRVDAQIEFSKSITRKIWIDRLSSQRPTISIPNRTSEEKKKSVFSHFRSVFHVKCVENSLFIVVCECLSDFFLRRPLVSDVESSWGLKIEEKCKFWLEK